MWKLLLLVAVAATACGAVISAGGATAATQGGCKLDGVAKIPAGLTGETKPISYTFTGKFSSCRRMGRVTSGRVAASGKGTGSCNGSQTRGTATITWNTGRKSYVRFTTSGIGTVDTVSGKVTSGKFAGSKANADLVFSTNHPEACLSSGGLHSASFTGISRIGF